MPRRKQQAPKRLKGSEEGGEEEGDGDGKQASSPSTQQQEQPTSPKAADDPSTDDTQQPSPGEDHVVSPKSPQQVPQESKLKQSTVVTVIATATSEGKLSPSASPQGSPPRLPPSVEVKPENGGKLECHGVVVPTPKLLAEPPMISSKNEHIEKLKETLNFNLMNSKWRDNVIKSKTNPLDALSRSLENFHKRRPPDTVQRLPESVRGEAFRESLQSRRVSEHASLPERPPRDPQQSKRSLGPHPTEIPLKKHHKMPSTRPLYDSDSDSEEEYQHRMFRGLDRKMFSHPMFASPPPPPPPVSEQNEALDLRVKRKSSSSKDSDNTEHIDNLSLTTKIERHDDNCSKCESGSSQYVHNKLVKTVFCEAVPRDVLASVSRLQTDYSVLPPRVNLCRAVNGRCNFVVCTDCYQAFPNVGMLSLHLIATGHSSTKQVNTEALLQRGYLALVPPRTEFFSTCALRRKQRTPTTGGRKEVCVYTCSVCSVSFPDFLDYTVHLTTTGHDKSEKTPKPSRKLSASDYPEEIPVNQVMKCLICQSSFRTLKDLTMHMVRTKHYTHVPVHDSVLYSKLGTKDDYRLDEDEDMCIDNAADREERVTTRPPQITHPSLSPSRNFRNHRREERHPHREDRHPHREDRHPHREDRHPHREDRHPHREDRHHHRNEKEHKHHDRHHRMDVDHKEERHAKEHRQSQDDRSSREEMHRKDKMHHHRSAQWQEEMRMNHKEPKHHSHPHKDKDDKKAPSDDGSASSNTKQALNQMLASKRRSPKSYEDENQLKGLGKKSRSLKCIGCEHLFADVPKLSKHMKETGHYMIPPGPDDVDQKIMHTSSLSKPNGKYSHLKLASSLAKHQLGDSKKKSKEYTDDDVVVKMEDYFADDSDDEEDLFNRNEKPEVEKLQEKVDSMFSDSGGEKDTASSTSSAPIVECVGKYVDPDNFDVVFPTGSRVVGASLGSNPLGSLASMVETAKEMNFTRTAFTANADRWSRPSPLDEPGCSVQAASEDSYKTAAAAAAAAAVAAAAAEAARSAAARAAAAARSSALVSAAASYPTAISPISTVNTIAIKKEWDDAKILAKCAKKHKEDGMSNVTVAEAIEKILSSSFSFIKDEEKNTSLKESLERNVHKRRKQSSSSSDVMSPKRKEDDVHKHNDKDDKLNSPEKQTYEDTEKDCEIKDTDSRTESQSSTPCPMEQEDIIEKKEIDMKEEKSTSDAASPTLANSPASGSDSQEEMSTDEPISNNDIDKSKDCTTPEQAHQVSVLCENRRVTRRTAKYMSQTENGDLENCRKSPVAKLVAMPTSISLPEPKETNPSPKSNHSEEVMSETEAERGVRIKLEMLSPSPVQNGAKSPRSDRTISPCIGNESNHSSDHDPKSPLNHQEPNLHNHQQSSPHDHRQSSQRDHRQSSPRDPRQSSPHDHRQSSPQNHRQPSPADHQSNPASPMQPKDLSCLPIKIKIKQEPRDGTPSPNNHHRSSASPTSKPLNNNNTEAHHHSPHIKGPASSSSRTNKFGSFLNSIPGKYNCQSPFSSSNSNPLQDLDKLVNSTTSTIQSPAPPKIAKFSAEVFGRRYIKRQQDLYINPASENHLSTNPLEEMDKMVNATKERF